MPYRDAGGAGIVGCHGKQADNFQLRANCKARAACNCKRRVQIVKARDLYVTTAPILLPSRFQLLHRRCEFVWDCVDR